MPRIKFAFKRLAAVAKTLEDFGHRVQYSVFLCQLSDLDRVRLRERLRDEINSREDRVLFVDLGGVKPGQTLPASMECLGAEPEVPNNKYMIF